MTHTCHLLPLAVSESCRFRKTYELSIFYYLYYDSRFTYFVFAMAIVSSYSNKRVLILDDMPEMRSSLRIQVASLGIDQVALAANVRDALEHLKIHHFDLMLCDYYLGGSTDGQQFLEYLRTKKIISRSTIVIMITAEQSYESVITAAECMPDDYLLKPFTADAIKVRLDRLLEKKVRLAQIDKLQDQGRWSEIIPACDEILAAKDKYLVDAMRVKGNALIMTRRFDDAVAFYKEALQLRSMPWAKLGLAKAQQGSGNHEHAKCTLQEIIAETPRFLAAYDALGHLHRENGQMEDALKILDDACVISPNALARHRAIAKVAEEASDFGRVEKALKTVLQKTINSPLRDLNDYATLGNALTELGDHAQAIAVIDEAKKNFKNSDDSPILASTEAIAHHKAGNADRARSALARTMKGGAKALSDTDKIAVAKAYLLHGQHDEAEQMLKHVVQNTPGQTALHGVVVNLMKVYGAQGKAENFIEESHAEVIQLNNDAVKIGQSGDLKAAAAMMREAAERLPGNLQILANASYALLLDMLANGIDAGELNDANRYRKLLVSLDQHHPKLDAISEAMAKLQSKFNVSQAS